MRLAVVASADPEDVRTWSGTPYFMTRALRKGFPDLLPVREPWPRWLGYARRAARKATFGRVEIYWSSPLARRNAFRVAGMLRHEGIDLALCIGNAPLSAFLADYVPTVHVSDTTVPLMRGYYAEFANLLPSLAQSAWRLDRCSALGSRACLYSTTWAARSAIEDYGADRSRVHVVPWGANLHPQDVPTYAPSPRTNECHLVFIGVDWRRKGGTIAIDAATRLSEAGRAVKLHIIGAKPDVQENDNVIAYGFIDKRTETGRQTFSRIMGQAAFLFVPTRQDCSPMVFPEANSYGIPVITTSTGGVPDVVHEGVNGHLLPLDATAEQYADLIWSVWADRPRYERLRRSSRTRFDQVLNWDAWLSAVVPILEDALSTPASVHQTRSPAG